jgi:hypothetical protein
MARALMIYLTGGWKANAVIDGVRRLGGKIRREDALRLLRGQLPLDLPDAGLASPLNTVPLSGSRNRLAAVPGTDLQVVPAPDGPRVSPPAPPVSVTPLPLEREREARADEAPSGSGEHEKRFRAERAPAWKFARWVFDEAIAAGVIPGHRAMDPAKIEIEVRNDFENAIPLIASYGIGECEARARRMITAIKSKKMRRPANCLTLSEAWGWSLLEPPARTDGGTGNSYADDILADEEQS